MMRFFVFLYVVVLYVRPGEIFPDLAGVPINDYLTLLCGFAALGSLLLDLRSFWNQPHDKFLILFFFVIVISNPLSGFVQGGLDAFNAFLPVAFCYFLIRIGIRNQRDVVSLAVLLVVLNVFLAFNGILQATTGSGFFGVVEPHVGEEGVRIRGTGIFNDPNDLGMTLVTAVPILLSGLVTAGGRGIKRLFALAGLIVVLWACLFTNSRGTVLGLGAVFSTFLYRRYGLRTAVVFGSLALVGMIAFGPSRAAEISSEEESAQGRIQAWIAGYDMLRSSPIWGVGYGMYMDYHELVAHNSFVHVLGELGLAGGFTFVGMFYWMFRGLRTETDPVVPSPAVAAMSPAVAVASLPGAALSPAATVSPPDPALSPDAALWHRWSADLTSSCIGMATCMFFLSRQYIVVVYIVLALCACQAHLTPRPRSSGVSDVLRIGGLFVAMVIGVYLLARVLVRY
jgi:O-antigen ligase